MGSSSWRGTSGGGFRRERRRPPATRAPADRRRRGGARDQGGDDRSRATPRAPGGPVSRSAPPRTRRKAPRDLVEADAARDLAAPVRPLAPPRLLPAERDVARGPAGVHGQAVLDELCSAKAARVLLGHLCTDS